MFDNLIMRLKYKFHICQQKGCWKHGDEITECWLPDYEIDDEGFRVDEKPDEYYCMEHAARNGFCKSCGEFWGGIESFEFEHPGWCDNCHDQMEHDFHIGDDGDEWDLVDWNDDPYDAQHCVHPTSGESPASADLSTGESSPSNQAEPVPPPCGLRQPLGCLLTKGESHGW